jgi:hypothetical protein
MVIRILTDFAPVPAQLLLLLKLTLHGERRAELPLIAPRRLQTTVHGAPASRKKSIPLCISVLIQPESKEMQPLPAPQRATPPSPLVSNIANFKTPLLQKGCFFCSRDANIKITLKIKNSKYLDIWA